MTRNLCVNSTRLPGIQLSPFARKSQIRCKTIPPVHTLADARRIAYRLAQKLDLSPGSNVSIRVERKSRGEDAHSGRRYFFNVTHGRIDCHVGSQFGPSCDERV